MGEREPVRLYNVKALTLDVYRGGIVGRWQHPSAGVLAEGGQHAIHFLTFSSATQSFA
jgi:hypothetical protein